MPKSPLDLLFHIREECEYLESIMMEIPSMDDFLKDETFKRAVVRSLEIIGEASKKLGEEFQSKWPEVEWREMGSMRNVLIHVYFGINYNIVWDVLMNKIPELNEHVKKIIIEESK